MVMRWAGSDLQTQLYRWYISERESGTMEIKEIAALIRDTEYGEKWGHSARLIYAFIEGTETPPPEFFPALFEVTKDRRIIMWFVERCPDVTVSFNADVTANGTVTDESLNLTVLNGTFAGEVVDALADGKVDAKERERMTNTLLDMRSQIDSALNELKVTHETGVVRTKKHVHILSVGR